ncbi:unnamed protein product [Durusdinium trenchii]|uniref:Uncharacterized protein n=2 Tax=Durusdinium trenchii TaxID=1381693 RepID=A0ABP0KZE3_9DINO
MRKALAARYLEHLTGDDVIDLDELIGADDDEDFISASLQNAIQEISSGGSTAGKQMRALKAHVQDSAQPYGHHSMTKRLGQMSGKNNSRDWWRMMKDGPAIEQILLPIKYTDLDDGIDKFKLETWPVMDPHSIAHFLFEHAGLQIPAASLRDYWEFHSQHGEHWAQGVPFDAMPIGVYGDGARVNTKFGSTNLVGIYFNFPLWKPGSVRASRFLVTVIPEEKLWRHYTLNCILRRLTWSVNCLQEGHHPERGPGNQLLPKHLEMLAGRPFKFKCVLTEIRGDWQ